MGDWGSGQVTAVSIMNYLAPTGAQEMLIFVGASVRPFGPSLSEALNLNLFSSDSLQEHSESNKQAFREHSEHFGSNQTASYRRSLKYFVLLTFMYCYNNPPPNAIALVSQFTENIN